MKRICLALLMCFIFSFIQKGNAQDSETWRIVTTDGNTYLGTLVAKTQDSLSLKTKNLGLLKFAMTDIVESEVITGDKNDPQKFWPKNHHSTRYFVAPNAYTLNKGESYYQNNWVLLNQYSYGFTDRFTMGVGVFPSFFFNSDNFPVWITPKVRLTREDSKVGVSIGALAAHVVGENEFYALPYAVTTFGNENSNVTLGGGYFFQNNDNVIMLNFSGMRRLNKTTYLVTENYFFPEGGLALISLGGRSAWRTVALDYGIYVPVGVFDFNVEPIFIPWLGISVPFGHKNELVPARK